MRRAAKKDANRGEIVRALEAVGASVTVLDGAGVTDLVVGHRGANYLLEVKDPAKPPSARKLTPAQEKWHATWRGQKAVVETVDQALAVVLGKKDMDWHLEPDEVEP